MTNDEAQADPDADVILTKHADAHIVTSQEIAAILVRLGLADGHPRDVTTRLRMLEAQMEQVKAQVEGLALGIATLTLTPESRRALAEMLAVERVRPAADRTNIPPEEGTPGS